MLWLHKILKSQVKFLNKKRGASRLLFGCLSLSCDWGLKLLMNKNGVIGPLLRAGQSGALSRLLDRDSQDQASVTATMAECVAIYVSLWAPADFFILCISVSIVVVSCRVFMWSFLSLLCHPSHYVVLSLL